MCERGSPRSHTDACKCEGEIVTQLAATKIPSFRAVPPQSSLAGNLGPLAELPGHWSGTGFNLIARPDFQQSNDIFLELNVTRETIEFMSISSPIPNRGSTGQEDITLFGVHYLQQIQDATTGGALHIEPGIWLNVPATNVPLAPASVTRLASIPHGDAINASGISTLIAGPPPLGALPANTVPFPVGGPVPAPGALNPFVEYNLGTTSPFRTADIPPEITQTVVGNPNSLLDLAIAGQTIVETEVLAVATTPAGGIENIPFLVGNANAVEMSSTFWIEKVSDGLGHTHLQLQYSQSVLLSFLGQNWPHVSVATLKKIF